MATAPPTVTFTSVAGVCTHLRNGARRLLRKVPELELAAQNGHCALFASMIEDNELYYCSPACKRMDVQHENLCQEGMRQARGIEPRSRGGDGRIGASGDARVCSACKSTLSSSSFSAKQYKAKASKRRCMACIASSM